MKRVPKEKWRQFILTHKKEMFNIKTHESAYIKKDIRRRKYLQLILLLGKYYLFTIVYKSILK